LGAVLATAAEQGGLCQLLAPVRTPFSLDRGPKAAAIAHCHHQCRAVGYRPIARARFNIASAPSAAAVAQRLDDRPTATLEAL